MSRTVAPRINQHVTYYTAAGKPQPGTIIAVTSATVVNLRIAHTGTVVTAAPRRVNASDVSCWQVP